MGWQHKNTLISNVAWQVNDKGILTKKYDKITLTYSQLAISPSGRYGKKLRASAESLPAGQHP